MPKYLPFCLPGIIRQKVRCRLGCGESSYRPTYECELVPGEPLCGFAFVVKTRVLSRIKIAS